MSSTVLYCDSSLLFRGTSQRLRKCVYAAPMQRLCSVRPAARSPPCFKFRVWKRMKVAIILALIVLMPLVSLLAPRCKGRRQIFLFPGSSFGCDVFHHLKTTLETYGDIHCVEYPSAAFDLGTFARKISVSVPDGSVLVAFSAGTLVAQLVAAQLKVQGYSSKLLLISYTRSGLVSEEARELWMSRGRDALDDLLFSSCSRGKTPPLVNNGLEQALAKWRGEVAIPVRTHILHGVHDAVYPMPSCETCEMAKCSFVSAGHGLLLSHPDIVRSWVESAMRAL